LPPLVGDTENQVGTALVSVVVIVQLSLVLKVIVLVAPVVSAIEMLSAPPNMEIVGVDGLLLEEPPPLSSSPPLLQLQNNASVAREMMHSIFFIIVIVCFVYTKVESISRKKKENAHLFNDAHLK
jgi:hypothetical protein